ncbi:MAG: polysaccharide biosynthesis tyrosine autokinase [Verrucomicrobiales bacterium]|nr:polysaccharide biosynthesis tyrosine autokinase [Verrucomicrobiales bacterium]
MSQSYSSDPDANDAGQSRGLQDFLRWFLRRFWIFLIALVGGYFLGLYLYSVTPPTYQSSATIEILRVKRDAADIAEEEKIRMTGAAEMLSASERIRLPQIYIEAAKGQVLANRENILPAQKRFPWVKPLHYSSEELSPEVLGAMLRGWVSVRWRTDTTLLDLTSSHTDPAIARDSLAAVLSAYEQLSESRVEGSSEYVLDYILDSSAEIKDRLLSLESTLQLYQRCLALSKEIDEAERQVAEMEKRYLPKWPALVEAKELLRILETRFVTEFNQVMTLSEEERKFWESSAVTLANASPEELNKAKRQVVSTRSSVLERERDAEKSVYDNLILQLKEGNVTRGFASRQFEVVQPPTLPTMPVSPIKSKMLIQFAGGGAALGLGIILLLGFLDPTLRTVSEVEQFCGIPVVAGMPAFKKRDTRAGSLELAIDPQSKPSEAIRTLRAGLTFLGTAEERCTFLITSSVPGEGKSWVASNLAHSFALQGDRTLLIDADMRRPVQGEVFGYGREPKGLSDVLSLGTPLKEVILRSEVSEDLFLIPAGSWSANPAELLSGKSLRPLLEKLSEYFDRIVIDSAPLVPVSDTIPIAKLVQSVVLVARMGRTPKGAIKRAIRLLTDNGSHPVGVVANGLPRTRTMGAHGYYYSYSSSGSYSGYSTKES